MTNKSNNIVDASSWGTPFSEGSCCGGTIARAMIPFAVVFMALYFWRRQRHD